MNHNDELMHFGVKGMKWGVRKSPKERYVSNYKARSNASKAAKAAVHESYAKDMKAGTKKRQMRKNARVAAARAQQESYIKDLDHNRALNVAKRGKVTKSQMRKDVRNAHTIAANKSYIDDFEKGGVPRYKAYANAHKAGKRAAQEMLASQYGQTPYKSSRKKRNK